VAGAGIPAQLNQGTPEVALLTDPLLPIFFLMHIKMKNNLY
jgi:hypothetical protein